MAEHRREWRREAQVSTAGDVNAARTVAQIHHSAVAASAIGAAWELGALDELAEAGVLDTGEFADRHGLAAPATVGMFRALAAVGIVTRHGTKVVTAENFAEVYRTRSFFHWLSRGSAELFRALPDVLRLENRVGDFIRRDSAAIAFACQEINTLCYDPWFWPAIDRLDVDVTVVADLGCGGGQRIIDILRRYPNARGIGIDIAASALELARGRVREAGLDNRAMLVEADVTSLTADRQEFSEVDLLTCFMMGHDFWPRQQCVEMLERLRRVFPNLRRFLLGDATRHAETEDRDLPVFAVAFELAHAVMGKYIPTLEEWQSVFQESGWQLVKTHSINIAVNEVIFELEPHRPAR